MRLENAIASESCQVLCIIKYPCHFSALGTLSVLFANSSAMERKPKVGVAVIIPRDGRILVGKRRSGKGPGTWSVPGGHLEYGETFEQCARREAREEIGVELEAVSYLHTTNDLMPQFDEHSVTIWMVATAISGEITNASPREHERWEWHPLSEVPEPVFPSLANFRRARVPVPGLR